MQNWKNWPLQIHYTLDNFHKKIIIPEGLDGRNKNMSKINAFNVNQKFYKTRLLYYKECPSNLNWKPLYGIRVFILCMQNWLHFHISRISRDLTESPMYRTEVRFSSFLYSSSIMALINPPERKLAKRKMTKNKIQNRSFNICQ